MSPSSDSPLVKPAPSAGIVTPTGEYEEASRLAIRSGGLLVVRLVVFGLVSLAGSTFLIRQLGPEDWAAYSIAYFLAVFLSDFFGATVLGGLIHGTTPSESRRQAAVRMMQVLGVAVAALVAVASVPVARLYGDDELIGCMLAVAACALIYATRAPSVALLERNLQYKWVAGADLIDQLTFYAVAIPLVLGGHGLAGVAAALASRGVVSTILLLRRSGMPRLGRWHGGEIRSLARFARPSLASSGLNLLTGLIPAIVLGGTYAEELAFVVASATLLGYAASVQYIVQRVGFPGLTRLRGLPEAYAASLDRALVMTNFVMISLVVPLTVLSPLILPFLFGPEWSNAVPVFAAIAAGVLLNGVATLGTASLNSLDAPGSVLRLSIFTTVSYLLLALGLTRVDPLLGVGLAFAASRGLGWLVCLRLLHNRGVELHAATAGAVLILAVAAMSGLSSLVQAGDVVLGLALLVLAAFAWLAWQRDQLRRLIAWSRRGARSASLGVG